MVDQNRLADLREKLEEIRAKRGDMRPVGPLARPAAGTAGPFDGKGRFVVVAAILAIAMYYLF